MPLLKVPAKHCEKPTLPVSALKVPSACSTSTAQLDSGKLGSTQLSDVLGAVALCVVDRHGQPHT